MKRRRIERLRDTLRSLRPCTHILDPHSESGYTGTLELTGTDTLCARAAGLPRIDTLDMYVEHGLHTDGNGESRVLGCISAVAILLFPDEAAEAARTLPDVITVCDASNVAQEVLGLEDEIADTLFNDHPDKRGDRPIAVTPEQAAAAVERVLAGAAERRIWEHAHPEATTGNNETARNFLDRRDEARISHRLGRPFRF